MSSKLPNNELKYWLSFNQLNIIGPIRVQKLLNYFPNLETAWTAPRIDLLKCGIEEKIAGQIIELRANLNPEQELGKLLETGVKVITIKDEAYPKALKEIYAPPPLLYYLGNIPTSHSINMAVVGSRKISEYGKLVTKKIVADLVNQGFIITSGLAFGIDACAHQTTLKNHGTTIAVLGCGLEKIYPLSHHGLAQQIIEANGAIISEFPITMPPLKHNFPIRNRLISGLAVGTLVVEANEKSGALITAQYALEQNREVFAVPGNIFHPNSIGPNNLIKLGAKLVGDAKDIMEVLNFDRVEKNENPKINPETEIEKKLFEILKEGPLHVDKIAQYARLDISIINSNLSVMEIKGLVRHLGSNVYSTT